MSPGESKTIERNGLKFRIDCEYDDSGDTPWEACDGHGPVSEWTSRAKRPGEMVLASDGGSHRFYDYAEALRIAKRDKWGMTPDGVTRTANQIREAAVQSDYQFLKRWCDDEWCYVGLVVTALAPAYDELLSLERERFIAEGNEFAKFSAFAPA